MDGPIQCFGNALQKHISHTLQRAFCFYTPWEHGVTVDGPLCKHGCNRNKGNGAWTASLAHEWLPHQITINYNIIKFFCKVVYVEKS